MKKNEAMAVGAVALGVGLLFLMGAGGEPVEEPPEEDEPDEEEEEEESGGGGGGGGSGFPKVPSKTGAQPWNSDLLPNESAVRAAFAGLAPKYTGGAQPFSSAAAYKAVVGQFQRDWNALLMLGQLSPMGSLAGKLLKVDEAAGFNTLKALEWAMGMGWPARLLANNLM